MTIDDLAQKGTRRRTTVRRRGARAVPRRADAPARSAGRRGPAPPPSGSHRHLHHRPQRQLHERVRGAVLVLRVLPAGRRRGRLRARLRRDLPQDRGDDRTGRRAAAAAGRPQPRPAHRVVRGSLPRGEAALPRVQAARAVVARRCCTSRGSRSGRCPRSSGGCRRGPRQHPGRRGRDPRRPGPKAPALLQQGQPRTSGST